MTKQMYAVMSKTIEIEADIPKGWEAVAYRVPLEGEWYLTNYGPMEAAGLHTLMWLILRRKEPVRESRWVSVYERSTGYLFAARHQCDVASGATSPRVGVIRLDYEDNKLVAVALEPLGEGGGE